MQSQASSLKVDTERPLFAALLSQRNIEMRWKLLLPAFMMNELKEKLQGEAWTP